MVNKLLSQPSEFHFDETDQVYVHCDNVERIYLDSYDKSKNFTGMCDKIVATIPDITFDLDSNDLPSAQVETANVYKCCVMNQYADQFYLDDIRKLLDGYNFATMKTSNNEYGFTDLLKRIQEESNVIDI